MKAHPYLVAHLASQAMFRLLFLTPTVEVSEKKGLLPQADSNTVKQIRSAIESILADDAHPVEARQEAVGLILESFYECAFTLGQQHARGSSQGAPPQPEEPEQLFISKQCSSKYKGEWVRPAQLRPSDITTILEKVSGSLVGDLHTLLVTHGNRPKHRILGLNGTLNRKLRDESVGGKYYRLATGTDTAGNWQHQLWEVRPKS